MSVLYVDSSSADSSANRNGGLHLPIEFSLAQDFPVLYGIIPVPNPISEAVPGGLKSTMAKT